MLEPHLHEKGICSTSVFKVAGGQVVQEAWERN